MPEADLSLLLDAGEAAGQIAMRYFKANPEVWDKGNNQGPVSQADLEIDKMLRGELLLNRPDYGWLSEETDDDPARFEHETVFIIDPIDGTRAFIAGQENFAISMAIATAGKVTHGVVTMPAKGPTYSASLGFGAFKDGERLTAKSVSSIEGARVLAATAQMESPHWKDRPPRIDRHFRSSLAYRCSLVAEGKYDAMLTLRPTWEWDVAAGDIICREAGAEIRDRCGAAPSYNGKTAQHDGFMSGGGAILDSIETYLARD